MIRVYDLVRVPGTTEEIYDLTTEGEEFESEHHWEDHVVNEDGMILGHSDNIEDELKNNDMIYRLLGRIRESDGGRLQIIYQSCGDKYRPVVIFYFPSQNMGTPS